MASMFSLYDHIILQANASSPALHHSILHCFQSPKYYSFNTGKLRQENLCSFEARQVYIENLVSKTKQTKDARNFLRHTGRGALCQGTAYRRQHGKIIPQNTWWTLAYFKDMGDAWGSFCIIIKNWAIKKVSQYSGGIWGELEVAT